MSRRRIHRTLHGEQGAVIVIVAFALVMLLGFAALLVDIGNARQDALNLQTAADAGSLAGAQQLVTSASSAETYAADYAFDSANQPRGTPGSCPGGVTATACYENSSGAAVYVTTPYTASPPPANGTQPLPVDQIHVMMCQTIQTTFARVLRIDTTHPCKSSTADIVPGTSTFPCAVCVMSDTGNPALSFEGNSSWTVAGGSILVNSSSSGGISESGNSGSICDQLTPSAPGTNCNGSITWYACKSTTCPVGHGGSYLPVPTPQPTQIPDPLAFLPVPNFTTPTGKCTGGTCTPGVYTSSISGNETLKPGNYILVGTNATLNPGQGKTITGTGVTIYLACKEYPTPCKSGEAGADINYNGGTVNISGPTSSGATPLSSSTQAEQGLAIYSDRNNTSSIFSLGGNASIIVKGTIYGLNASVELGGTPNATFDSIFVVDTIDIHGNPGADDEVPADNVHIPPTSASINLIG